MPPAVLLTGLILGATCSFYFCYVAGAEGRSPLGMLRIAGFLPMLISVTSAIWLAAQLGVWGAWHPFPPLLTLLVIAVIVTIPFGAYTAGFNKREQLTQKRREAQQQQERLH